MDTGEEKHRLNYCDEGTIGERKQGQGDTLKIVNTFCFLKNTPRHPQSTQTRSKMSDPLPPARYLYRLGEQPHSQGDRPSACLVTMRWQGQEVTQICLLSLWAPQNSRVTSSRGGKQADSTEGSLAGKTLESPAGSGPRHSLWLSSCITEHLSLAIFWEELGGLWSPHLS